MLDTRQSLLFLMAVAGVLAAMIFAVDLRLPLGVASGVPYVAVVLFGWWLPKRRYILMLALGASALVVAEHFLSPPGGVPGVVLVNRFLALFAIWVTAMLLFVIRNETRAREESEERFRDMIEAASDWIWEMGPDLRFTHFSDSIRDIAGAEPDALLGKSRPEVTADRNTSKWKEHRNDLENRRPFRNFEYELGRSDGTTKHIAISGKPIYGRDGEFRGYRGTGTDITSSTRAQKELRESEERLRLILENAVIGIITIDEQGTIESFNPAAERIFGYEAKEVIGRDVITLMPEPYRTEHDGYIASYLETGEARIIGIGREVEGLRKNGTAFPMELGVSELALGGKRRVFTGIITDVSERKRAEAALRESEERFRDLAETASDWFWEMDADLRFTYVSEKFFEVTGWRPEDIIGKTRSEITDAESLDEGADAWIKHRADLEARRPFANFVRSLPGPPGGEYEGRRFYIQLSGRRRFDGKGAFIGYRGTATDITREIQVENEIRRAYDELEERVAERTRALSDEVEERTRAEEALRTSEERFRGLVEQAADAFFLHDRSGRFVDVNDRACMSLGYPRKELLGLSVFDIEVGIDPERLEKMWAGMEPGKALTLNGIHRRKNDTCFPVEIRIGLHRSGGREFMLALARDMTERRQADENLRRAKEEAEFSNRAKSEFLANMSHELRTPLNSIIGFSDMLRSQIFGTVDNPKYLEYLNDINTSGRHLLDLIKDILDVSKIEAGAMEMVDEDVDIGAAIQASVKMIGERAQRAGVAIHTETPEDIPHLRGDLLRVKQILLNLLGNAVKFTPSEGEVTVRAGLQDGGNVFVAVEDTGIGIAADDLGRVTEPFAQVVGSQTRGYEGTGLGLALVKSLMELHDGALEINSEPGEGTLVTVTFPRARTLPIN